MALEWADIREVEEHGEKRRYGSLCSGIGIYRKSRSLLVVPPDDGFRVLSSGFYNGGLVDSPVAITNTTSLGGDIEMDTMGRSRAYHDSVTRDYLEDMGLDPGRVVALGTAAHMDNAAICNTVSDNGVSVGAVITGGIRGNGGRAGDPANYDEATAHGEKPKPGTIVIILAVDAHLSDRALVEAMDVATQSKSCVIQELMARSLYSHGVATGSGTDQVAVITRTDCAEVDSGTALGEDIGRAIGVCVKTALYETFDRQSYMVHDNQCDPYVVLARYGITESRIHDEIRFPATMKSLLDASDLIRRDKYTAAVFSAALHLADQANAGIIPYGTALAVSKKLVSGTVLKGIVPDPVVQLRLDRHELIERYLSLAMALKILDYAQDFMEGRR